MRRRRLGLLGALTATSVLACVAPALGAGTVDFDSGFGFDPDFVFSDTSSTANSVSLVDGSLADTVHFVVLDGTGISVTPAAQGEGCTELAGNTTVRCPESVAQLFGVRVRIEMVVDAGPLGDTVTTGGTLPVAVELFGGAGNDTLTGGPGNDLVVPGAGQDVPNGGAGSDRISYDDARASGVSVNLLSTSETDGSTTVDGSESAINFENVDGTPFADGIVGNDGPNDLRALGGDDTNLDGLDGDDVLQGGTGNDSGVDGGDGNDTLLGEDGNDGATSGSFALQGGNGDDVIVGGPGDDGRLDGGTGSDTVSYDDGRASGVTVNLAAPFLPESETVSSIENIRGTSFNDGLTGDPAVNVIEGLAGNDSLRGGDENDRLIGGSGADSLLGDGGTADVVAYSDRSSTVTIDFPASGFEDGDTYATAEIFEGGTGNDIFRGASGVNDTFRGMAGNDEFRGGVGPDTITGGDGSDTIRFDDPDRDATISITLSNGGSVTGDGDLQADEIENAVGGPRDDLIQGNAGANVLDGGGGSDTLVGGLGTDVLRGGDGDDLASYRDRTAAGTGVTVRLDGTPNDGAPGENDDLGGDIEGAEGGAGNDSLTGAAGVANRLLLGAGDDTFASADGGPDTVDCGPGADAGQFDPVDSLTNCESATLVQTGIDKDADGIAASVDCNDNDAAIRPGAKEIVGNKVDENCDGTAAPFPLIGSGITNAFRSFANFSVLITLTVSRLPAGAKVELACTPAKKDAKKKGKKSPCALRKKTISVKQATKELKLAGQYKNRKLTVGTVVRITVTAPDTIGKIAQFTVRRKKAPSRKVTCIAPGDKPTSC